MTSVGRAHHLTSSPLAALEAILLWRTKCLPTLHRAPLACHLLCFRMQRLSAVQLHTITHSRRQGQLEGKSSTEALAPCDAGLTAVHDIA